MTQTATVRLTLTPAQVLSVHDGDTLRAVCPLEAIWPDLDGFTPDIRVAHCNAAELSKPDGQAARTSVSAWLAAHGPDYSLHVYGREKYGRLLADLESAAGDLLSAFVLTLPGSVPLALRDALAL